MSGDGREGASTAVRDLTSVSDRSDRSDTVTYHALDFFSGSGSSYLMGKAEDTADDDWEF
ncbi:hypothetical protein [Streptomyces sp. Ac-502]|uniref:hypothetical protein n=1 Tax=Streptomyces sp. Ac-502 TaxID=3342801 RepID=UPI0038626F2C